MSFFSRKPAPEPRIQTLAEMIAYALTSEATRTGWRVSKDRKCLTHDALALRLTFAWSNMNILRTATLRKKELPPFNSDDDSVIGKAARKWLAWSDECRRTEGLLEFVDRFEAIAASVDTHPQGGDAVAAPFMGSAVGDSRDAQGPSA